MFIKPMLASPLPKDFQFKAYSWAADEKFDGHRLIVEISNKHHHLFTNKGVTAWSRYGIERQLPTHLLEDLAEMPDGLYDGELLVPGKRSYGVTELVNGPDLVYFIFDIIQVNGSDVTTESYATRQGILCSLFPKITFVQHAPITLVNTWDEVITLRDTIWKRDGEGLILKQLDAPYQIGKRSKNFIKIKALHSAILTIIGFIPSKGQIMNRGDYATVLLRDDDGNTTTVKTRNDALCRELEQQALGVTGQHPAIGRRLRIEYQERTPDGNYRHPRWDRWEDE